jgi:FKBP-type peptidyl-prolyl cis-trans isomerase FklB
MINIKVNIGFILILTLIAVSCNDTDKQVEKIELKTKMDTISYIIGLDYGIGIREQKIEPNQMAIYKGLKDGLAGESILSDSLKEKLIDDFNEELKIRLEKEGEKIVAQNKIDGAKFLEENSKKEGVIQLEDGLQYKILKEGKGESPVVTDSVLIHYRGMFTDGTIFDMSYDRGPVGVRLNKIIKGLSEGILLMKPGAIYELYIPPELAYGDKNFANVIPGGSTLIYSVELIKIIKEK